MSRSYRYTPCVQDNKRHSKKWARKQANRRVRHNLDISNGSFYKKLYEQWDICDFWSFYTLTDWLNRWTEDQHEIDNNITWSYGIKRIHNVYGSSLEDAKLKWKKEFYYK